jgi:hypothetical protein
MNASRPLLIALCLIALSSHAFAQVGKGKILLGGDFSYNQQKQEGPNNQQLKSIQVILNPRVGIGVGKNWIVGLSGGYGHAKQKYDNAGEAKVVSFSVGAFGRKFHSFSTQFGVFGQAAFDLGFGDGKNTPSSQPVTDSKIKSISAQIQPGLYFIAGKRFIVEATFARLGYTKTKTEFEGGYFFSSDKETSEFGVSISEGLSLGVKFVL